MDKSRSYQIKPDGSTTEVSPENGSQFSLAEMYQITESDIVEVVYLEDGRTMWLDEEGKINQKEPNPSATILAGNAIQYGDYIAGTVLVCPDSQVD